MRSIKPEFWNKLALASAVSRDARLLYIALWNQADEHSRMHGDRRWIKGHCLPYDDDLTLADIDRLVDELAAAGKVTRYTVRGEQFLHLPNLDEHQRLEPHKVPSRHPDPSESTPDPIPSAPRANEVAPGADTSGTIVAKHVACGSEHVAGEHVAGGPPAAARGLVPANESDNQRAQRLTAIYVEQQPLSNFPAVQGIVRKAMKVGHSDTEITGALGRLAADGRSVTTETLRLEIQGLPPRRGGSAKKQEGDRILREAWEDAS